MSSRELVISSTRHETRLAIMEDDQLVEVFFQRSNEYSLAGSIHKGRVTRVLPGMQSAFVDLGLERDTFLYVSDFYEEHSEDIDKVTGGAEERPAAPTRAAAPSREEDRRGGRRDRERRDRGGDRGERRGDRDRSRIVATESKSAADPLLADAGPALSASDDDGIPEFDSSFQADDGPQGESQGDLLAAAAAASTGGEAAAPAAGNAPRGDRDRGSLDAAARDARRGRRRGRGRGRGLPDSKYAPAGGGGTDDDGEAIDDSAEAASQPPAVETAQAAASTAPPDATDVFLLPGESLRK